MGERERTRARRSCLVGKEQTQREREETQEHRTKQRNTAILKKWIEVRGVHPKPTRAEKIHLASQANMTMLQVEYWFQNVRREIKKMTLEVWVEKHPTYSADLGAFPFQSVHDNFTHGASMDTTSPIFHSPYYITNQATVNGDNLPHSHFSFPSQAVNSEGVTTFDQQALVSGSNGPSVGYQQHYAFSSFDNFYNRSQMEHHSHGGETHSAAMVKRYGTTHLPSHLPRPFKPVLPMQKMFTAPPLSFTSPPLSSSHHSVYKFSCPSVVPQVITTDHSPYAADVPAPPQLLDTLENGPRADDRMQQFQSYISIPSLRMKEEAWNGATRPETSWKLNVPPNATAVTSAGTREGEGWDRSVRSAGGDGGSSNRSWAVVGAKERKLEGAVPNEHSYPSNNFNIKRELRIMTDKSSPTRMSALVWPS